MELVQICRGQGFGIWPTLSEPVQVRIGILNQLSQHAITDIVLRFATVLKDAGADIDLQSVKAGLERYYNPEVAAA